TTRLLGDAPSEPFTQRGGGAEQIRRPRDELIDGRTQCRELALALRARADVLAQRLGLVFGQGVNCQRGDELDAFARALSRGAHDAPPCAWSAFLSFSRPERMRVLTVPTG